MLEKSADLSQTVDSRSVGATTNMVVLHGHEDLYRLLLRLHPLRSTGHAARAGIPATGVLQAQPDMQAFTVLQPQARRLAVELPALLETWPRGNAVLDHPEMALQEGI